MKSLLNIFLVSGILSGMALAQTEDKNTLLQIAQGDKLVVRKDVPIPANTDRIYYGLKIDSGLKNSGCALVLNPSQKSRKIPQGGELVFSGVSQQRVTPNQYKFTDYVYTAGIMNSAAVVAVECYATSFESQFQDLYVSGMKNELKDTFDFVPSEPEITN